jgi:hypothetical protein
MHTTASFDGTTRQSREGGVLMVSDTPTGKNTQSTRAAIGGFPAYTTSYLNGYVAEMLIYHRGLTASEITQNETYLKNKWGL